MIQEIDMSALYFERQASGYKVRRALKKDGKTVFSYCFFIMDCSFYKANTLALLSHLETRNSYLYFFVLFD